MREETFKTFVANRRSQAEIDADDLFVASGAQAGPVRHIAVVPGTPAPERSYATPSWTPPASIAQPKKVRSADYIGDATVRVRTRKKKHATPRREFGSVNGGPKYSDDVVVDLEESDMEKKLCACGCGTALKEGSTRDFVHGHKKNAGGGEPDGGAHSAPAPRKPRKAAVKKTAARAASPKKQLGAVTLTVTEKHLNDYLLKLPIDRKLAIVQEDIAAQA